MEILELIVSGEVSVDNLNEPGEENLNFII